MTTPPLVLITGAGRGIGAACARLAARRGYDVAVNYLNDANSAAAVVRDVEAAGRRAVALQADMGREEDIARLFAQTDKRLGRISHLVYNTGIMGPPSPVAGVATATLRAVFDVNILGAFLCVREAVPRISKRSGGTGGAMVMLSSALASIGGANECVWYAASKGALESMTLGLARELVADGIRVNAVAPGPVATDIHGAGRLERLVTAVPMGRAGTPDEIAQAILFLLSEQSAWTDGAVLRIAGGR
ncbi:MAG: SDR family oxidoreductase [Proteobacteria bacterium]|nr:SDR family oxidoreductase [Pseudomonadota bacterium]